MVDKQFRLFAHDLSNKLAIIVGRCDLLLAKRNALWPETQQCLEQIRDIARYMTDQIRKQQSLMNSEMKMRAAKT